MNSRHFHFENALTLLLLSISTVATAAPNSAAPVLQAPPATTETVLTPSDTQLVVDGLLEQRLSDYIDCRAGTGADRINVFHRSAAEFMKGLAIIRGAAATSLVVHEESTSTPRISFVKGDGRARTVVTVTLNMTETRLLGARWELQAYGEMNDGTLAHPHRTEGWSTIRDEECFDTLL